jgi:hypothetical protein
MTTPERDVCDRARQALSDYQWAKACRVEVWADPAYRLLAELLAEVERLRANQRGETVEDWHGKCKGGQ